MFFILLISIIIAVIPYPVYAEGINNKFGIHLAQPHEEDIKKAAELVNSNGGDWGYVTLVIQENDRDQRKWQGIFNLLRKKHLIPIIRLATKPDGDKWKIPKKEEAEEWANFLSSFNWVIKNRYIVLFNEPNHGQEWGGKVDIDSYTEVIQSFASALKSKSQDFFIMPAGFDASAPSGQPEYEDEFVFLQRLVEKITSQEFEKLFDGWSSHAYPNPAFSGSAWDSGRKSIKGYQWELSVLKELGINKDLPVFITETGWNTDRLSREQIASYFQIAYENVWLPDKRVVAVTPFVLSYQADPFLGFSWKKFQSEDFYPQFVTVKELAKTKGEPEINEKGKVESNLPQELVEQSFYHFTINLTNEGQGAWDRLSGYSLKLEGYQGEYIFSDINNLEPFSSQRIDLFIKTNSLANQKTNIVLSKSGKTLLKKEWQYQVLSLPKLELEVELLPKMRSDSENLELQIFDEKENLVYYRNGIFLKDGKAEVDRIQNIILGEKYRLVLLKPYYLPRQIYFSFSKTANAVKFKRMLPLDFNNDGKFSLEDWGAIFQKPALFKNLLP